MKEEEAFVRQWTAVDLSMKGPYPPWGNLHLAVEGDRCDFLCMGQMK